MNARGTITVELNSTAGVASSLPSVCVNTAMSNITHSTTGATGIGVPSGLPAGVTASWLSDKITISGKPTEIGVFNYTIPLAGGCGNAAAKGTITVKSSPIATISVTDKSGTLNNDGVICKGETAILLVSGGSTYIWSNGETASLLSVTPDATTDYSVTITANDGCRTESRTKITVNENPSPAVTSINPDCPLSQTGSAAASNVANWTYLWSNGSNTASITGLVQGSYKLTVTNENGCKGSVTATLTDVSLPMTIGISKTDVICQGSKTGSVTVNMSGGTLPYSFLWSSNTGGAITNSLSNLAAGSYSVTVTEGSTSKCKVVGTVDIVEPAFGVQAYITIKENSGAKADDGIVCQNEEAELTVNAITFSGATLSTYQWNDVNGNRTSVLKTGTSGLYTVTVTDSKGCKTTVNKALTVTPVNTVSIGSSAPVLCINTQLSDLFHTTQGASGIGEASGLPAGVTAVWASNKITISGTPTESGIFNYSIPLSGGCDSVFAKGMITVKEENQVSQASHSPIICVSTPLTSITHSTKGVTGIGVVSGLPAGVTAAWSSNILTISGTPSETGVFNYLVPLTGGCGNISAKGIITVTLNNLAGTASSTPTLCVGTKLETITHTTIGATGIGTPVGLPAGVSATWANNTITIMGSPTESGNFNYSIPLTGGCGNISAKGAIYVKKNLNASVSIADKSGLVNNDGVICIGESAILTANGGSSFQWQNGETGSVIAVSPKVSTDYAVTVTGSDGCAEIVKTSITVHAKPNPTVIATNADCLMDQGGTALASSGAGWTYLWSNGMNTSTITGLVQGLYKVTVTDEKGCEETATATITDAGIPLTIDFTKTDIICQGTATGIISLNVTGGTGPYLYNWSSNAGGSTTSSITNLSKNSYFVTVTESGKKKCSAVSVVEIEEPEFGIQTNILVKENSGQLPDDAIICPRDAATFLVNTWVNPGSTISSFRWDDDANSTGNAILASTPGTYTVTVTDSKGCFTTVSKSLAVNSFNTVSVASSTPVICMNTVLSNITHTTTGATGIGVAEGLPAGVVATWSANVITISGIPLEDGQYNYSIPLIGGCGNVNATGKIIVNSVSTVSAASFTPSLCVQTTLPNITHYTTGVTGIGTSAGLPAGVVASWSANVITISGTPSEVGQFNYSIPLIGGCGNMIATGKIIVIPNSTVSAASSTPALCINTTLSNITHSTTGVTGIGIAYGLPTGVTATWSANLITITGTPLEGGQFNYSIPLIGGCGNINATGKIIVNTISTVSGASSAPRLCIQTPLTDITHYTTGATGVGTPTGLPAGVTATWASNVITISGIPAESGQFNYSIPLTGSCGDIKATGTITVIPANTASAASSSPKLIVNTILNDITHTTTGATGILTVTGLPAGLLPFWSANTITIRGTPSESGVFNYRVALAGGCSEVFATGTITVLRDNKVDSLLCDQFVLDNKEIYKDEPYDGVIILSYRGGNGTLFDGFTISSTGVNGLELSLQPGKLALGSGSVELVATGVPSDTGKAMFNVDFSTKTCVIELPVNVLLPKLSSLDCNNSQLTPDDLGKDVAYTGVLKINYQGGNNGKVGSVTLSSTGVTGLTLTGDSLRLNPLGGTLNYTVTGTPTSTGVAGFSITVGDKTCQILLNVIDNEVKLSSFFTPNGDGKNDRWEIPALVFYPESKVYIFDRTGRLLVEYAGDSPGWDGTIGNIPASSGDYWYVIQVTKDDIR
ncbi:MAG: T9SS type B sorting domain-containing protein, partial [Bacteroidota bacterium]